MAKRAYRKTFIREWREFRQLSLRELADRMIDPETGERAITAQSIGRIENRQQPYNQATLEALAEALGCEPQDLIMRNPKDTEAPWSIWETLSTAERNQAVQMLHVLKRTGTN